MHDRAIVNPHVVKQLQTILDSLTVNLKQIAQIVAKYDLDRELSLLTCENSLNEIKSVLSRAIDSDHANSSQKQNQNQRVTPALLQRLIEDVEQLQNSIDLYIGQKFNKIVATDADKAHILLDSQDIAVKINKLLFSMATDETFLTKKASADSVVGHGIFISSSASLEGVQRVLLEHVMRDNLVAAQAILEKYKNTPEILEKLLTFRSNVTDLSSNSLRDKTALMLAFDVGAVRPHHKVSAMVEMLLKYCDMLGDAGKEMALTQIEEQMTCEAENSPPPLDEAYFQRLITQFIEADSESAQDYIIEQFRNIDFARGEVKYGMHHHQQIFLAAYSAYAAAANWDAFTVTDDDDDKSATWARRKKFNLGILGHIESMLPSCAARELGAGLSWVAAGVMCRRSGVIKTRDGGNFYDGLGTNCVCSFDLGNKLQDKTESSLSIIPRYSAKGAELQVILSNYVSHKDGVRTGIYEDLKVGQVLRKSK